MADDVGYTPGSGATIAADDVGGVLYQRVKPAFGVDGQATDVSVAAPLPVAAYGELVEAIEALRMAVQALTRSGLGQTMPDTAARMRIVLDAITAAILPISISGTIQTLANQQQMGGFPATEQIPSLMRLGADSMRRNITVT